MTPDELRTRRTALGMSQSQLAAALGITEKRYQAWEVGRNTIPPFLGLALDALGAYLPQPMTLTVREAAARLGLTEGGVIIQIRRGVLPARRILNLESGSRARYLIAEADCAEYLKNHRNPHATSQGGSKKLTEAQAQTILNLRDLEEPGSLATQYQISRQQVWNIWTGRAWKHLRPKPDEEQ